MKLAEDDPPVRLASLVALTKQMCNLIKLAADLRKLRARPAEELLLACLDIDLRIHTDLTKAQQDTELCQHIGTTLESLCLPPL